MYCDQRTQDHPKNNEPYFSTYKVDFYLQPQVKAIDLFVENNVRDCN